MAIFDVNLYEPISAVVTADTTAHTADNTIWPTADGGILTGATDQVYAAVNANVLFADLYEPVGTVVTADITAYTADNATWPTADGGILEGARDFTDAEIISAIIEIPVGGARYPKRRPLPVIGTGFGILPQIEGEAFGAVIVAGAGVGRVAEFEGEAAGSIGVAGSSAGQLVTHAAAIGNSGQAGAAAAILKGLSVASDGAIGTRGCGLGMMPRIDGTGIAQHDDDDAAVITFLLAA
jgi:hypothetical protein